jgi:hypothetical protein
MRLGSAQLLVGRSICQNARLEESAVAPKEIAVFSDFEEAEAAEHRYYANMTPQERIDLQLELIWRWRQANHETDERLARVYRVVELG